MKYRILNINPYFYIQKSTPWPWVWDFVTVGDRAFRFTNVMDADVFIKEHLEPNLHQIHSECFRVNEHLSKLMIPVNKLFLGDKEKLKIQEQKQNYPTGKTKEEGIPYRVFEIH
jgi:hypothetical protein